MLLGLLLICTVPAAAAVFGPDGGGYTADTGATFAWVDATGGTSAAIFDDDSVSLALPIGFTFNFYGTDYTEFYVTTNGNVFFGSSSFSRAYNYSFQLADPANCIYAYAGDRAVLEDLDGDIFYTVTGTEPNRTLVIEWYRMQQIYYGDALPTWEDLQADVEVILYEGTNNILVQYDNLGIDPDTSFEGLINEDGSAFINPTLTMQNFTTSGTAILYTPGQGANATVLNAFPGRTRSGASYDWTLRLWNPTASAVDYDIAVSGAAWTTTPSDTTVSVPANDYADVTVTVEVPADAAMGAADSFTFSATVPIKAMKSEFTLTTTVTPDFYQGSDVLDITTSIEYAPFVAYDGKMYVFGGYIDGTSDTDKVLQYDPATDTWSEIATMPAADSSFRAAVVDGVAYLLGTPTETDVATYDFAGDSWSTGTDAPEGINDYQSAIAVSDGLIYIIGTSTDLAHCFVYDPSADTWTPLADSPDPRDYHTAAALDGKVYVLGGDSESLTDGDPTPDVLVYDIADDSWTTVTSTNWPVARDYINSFVKNGKIYLVGGYDMDYNISTRLPIFDPATEEWSFFQGYLPMDNSYILFGATDRYAVMAGGGSENDYTLENQTWVLDLCDTPAADFTADVTEAAVGDTVTFTSNSPDAPCNFVTFAWDFGDTGTADADPATHAYTAAGTYTVTLTVTNAWGEAVSEKTDYITVTEAGDDADDDADDADDAGDDTTVPVGGDDDDDDDDGGCCGC
jgi:hypothetical protein